MTRAGCSPVAYPASHAHARQRPPPPHALPPYPRRSSARNGVQLRLPFRHQTELQRRANRRRLVFTQLLQILLQLAVTVRAADHHQRRTGITHGSAYARRTLPSGLYLPPRCTSPSSPGHKPRPVPLSFSIRAMLTVNSPLRLINSFVPSSGSTSQ